MRVITGEIDGYTFTIEAPAYIVFDNSPMIVKISIKNNGVPSAGVRVQGVTTVGRDMFADNYRYTDDNGEVYFDFSKIVSSMRSNDASSELLELNHHSLWKANPGSWRFFAISGELTAPILFTAASGRLSLADKWRDKPLYLKWWKNYPFTFDYPNQEYIFIRGYNKTMRLGYISTGAKYSMVRVDPTQLPYIPTTRRIIYETGSTGFKIIRGELVDNITNEIIVDVDDCVNPKGVYLRWIGDHDEVYYWLFKRCEERFNVKSNVYKKSAYVNGYKGVEGNKTLLNDKIRSIEEISQVINISTDYISERYYDLLKSLSYSQAVDLYEDDGHWRRVTLEDSSLVKKTVGSDNCKVFQFNYNIILE